jgi:hypothetical protein
MLVGPTNYKVIGPYQHPDWVVKPVDGRLIENIRLSQVIDATGAALHEVAAVDYPRKETAFLG